MTKPKSIIPEFMIQNPDDIFMFLMPLKLKLDYENYANSHFIVAVKNLIKFSFHQAYKKGKQFRQYKRRNNDIKLQKKQFRINTELPKEKYDVALLNYMEEMEIGKVLGWRRKYLWKAKEIRYFVFEQQDYDIIIPHYTIAIYYYYRTTVMREATLSCNLEDLYIAAHNDGYNASIIIRFKILQVLREYKHSSVDIDSLDKLPTVPGEVQGRTTEVLKVEGASKRKQHTTVRTKRGQCNSLAGISISEDTVTVEGIDTLLKIYKEEASDETSDQSLTESSKNLKKKIRKTRVSSEYEKKQEEKKEYTHNFDEFHQYINYLKKQPAINNLTVSPNQNMEQVIDTYTDREHHKCNIEGRPRQYITATFQYKKIYVGLLELENKPGTATSTWVISSVKPVNQSVFDKFLYHFVDEDKKINDIKEEYKNNMQMRFSTKNHERSESLSEEDLKKWVIGVLGKLIKA